MIYTRENIKPPYYLYDKHFIHNQINKLSFCGLSEKNIHFSLMANNNTHLLTLIREKGLSVFVSSISELTIALKSGFTKEQIIFCSSNLKQNEIERIVTINPIIIADSYIQLERYIQFGVKQIGIRISFEPDFYKKYHSLEIQRQGISENQIQQTVEFCYKKNVKVTGIHSYLGTNISDIEFYKEGISKLIQCAIHFKDIEFIDISGGFGLDFTKKDSDFPIKDIVQEFHTARSKYPQLSNIDLKIEPGRYIMAPAGKFICSVIEVFKKDGKTFIGVDANLAIFPRPYIYKKRGQHLIEVYPSANETDKKLKNVYIVGNSAKSDDFFVRNKKFFSFVSEGDLLCFHYAGAYCYSMSSNFCGQLRPAEYLLAEDGNIQKIREEETIDVLLSK